MSDSKTFVACVDPDDPTRWMELVAVGNSHRIEYLRRDYVQPPGARADGVKRAWARWLKWVGRGLYGSPILWLFHVLLPAPMDGRLLVLFVCIAVLFYASINVYVVLAVIAWRAQKMGRPRLRPPHEDREPGLSRATESVAEEAPPPAVGSLVRARGKVAPLSIRSLAEGAVIRDVWLTDGKLGRLTNAVAFAVCAEGQLPVVLSFHSAPSVYAPVAARELTNVLPQLTERARKLWSIIVSEPTAREADVLAIQPGDEVEVIGVVGELIDDVRQFSVDGQDLSLTVEEGGAPGSPYRHDSRRAGVVMVSSVAQPVDVVLRSELASRKLSV